MITKEKVSCVNEFNEGLKMYRGSKFKEAINHFKKALEFDPNDGPSKTFIERCEHFIIEPPPEGWDGVYEMKSK